MKEYEFELDLAVNRSDTQRIQALEELIETEETRHELEQTLFGRVRAKKRIGVGHNKAVLVLLEGKQSPAVFKASQDELATFLTAIVNRSCQYVKESQVALITA